MSQEILNTLDPRLLQVHSLQPFVRGISASRADMFASEIGQAPPLKGAEIRRIQTGMERKFGKYTHMVKIPEDSTVIKVIHKRTPKGCLGQTVITSTTVVFRRIDGIYDRVIIPVHSQNHQQFGFDFVRTEVGKNIRKGDYVAKDTILAKSPSLDDNGNYKYGINANIAYMSIPEVILDGAVLSESFAKKSQFRGYTKFTLSFGENIIPLNINGDENEYKVVPDVGDLVNPNGLLFATRELREGLASMQMNRNSLRVVEETDTKTYINKTGARVIDIDIIHNRTNKTTVPSGMDDQCKRYWSCTKDYYRDLLDTYSSIRAECGLNADNLISPALHRDLVRAVAMTFEPGKGTGSQVNFANDDAMLNEWTLHVTVGYDLTPTACFKQAGDAGNKSVTVTVWKDEWMPIDTDGNRADIIMDGVALVNRLITSPGIEQYINASMVATHRRLVQMVENGQRQEAIDYLYRAYEIISPKMYEKVKLVDPNRHLDKVLKGGIYLWCPTDSPVHYPDVIEQLEKEYPPCFDKVKYRAGTGQWCETDKPVLIGSIYLIFLEKIGDDYSAVSSPVLQPQGIPGKLTRADKHASPGRPQAIRGIGETENRIVSANTDEEVASDMLSTSNSPITHKRQAVAYLTAPKPTNIQDVLQHDKYPRSGNRITDHVANSLLAGGFIFEYRDVEDD